MKELVSNREFDGSGAVSEFLTLDGQPFALISQSHESETWDLHKQVSVEALGSKLGFVVTFPNASGTYHGQPGKWFATIAAARRFVESRLP